MRFWKDVCLDDISVGYPPRVGCEEMTLWSFQGGPNYCKIALDIKFMIEGYFGYCTWGKGCDKSSFQPPLGGVTKIQDSLQPPLEKKTKREGKRRKLKEEAKSSYRALPTRLPRPRSATLSPSSCCSTIFGEIAPLSSSCAPNLDVWDPLVLSREELLYPHLIIVEKDLGGFGPWLDRKSVV